MGYLRGLNSAEPPADEHHRQGQRPGPAPNACEGNPKARSGAASPKGFTVRCFWVAARDWPCRVHRQTKGGFVRSGSADPRKDQIRQHRPFRQDLLPPASARAAGIAFLGPRSILVSDARSHGAGPSPSRPVPCATARLFVRCARRRPQASMGRLPSMGTLSAKASQGLARPDSRRHPRRSPRPRRASVHRGRCQVA